MVSRICKQVRELAVKRRNPYSEADLNWTEENSRVFQDYLNESQRETTLEVVTPENLADYDVIFIGYPIWWQEAAWPINDFVEENDFSGKTVIPFATSTSSDLGESGNLLAEMVGTGNWEEGQRFSSSLQAQK